MESHLPDQPFRSSPPSWLCHLPKKDPWSTPFAESLLSHLDLPPGATILDVASGSGVPAFYLANLVGPKGRVLGIDLNEGQLARARAVQGSHLPWLQFEYGDLRTLRTGLGQFDRITGNLAFMFFRPNRKETLQQLTQFLKPGGQLVLSFPSLGTFDSVWQRIAAEMANRGLVKERQALQEYVSERPSVADARRWLSESGLERVSVSEWPLEVETDAGNGFLYHPLLRRGFLDDVFECFTDAELAENVMSTIAHDLQSFVPLIAQRCVMSGWRPQSFPGPKK